MSVAGNMWTSVPWIAATELMNVAAHGGTRRLSASNTTPRPATPKLQAGIHAKQRFGQVKNRSSGGPDDLLRVPQNEKGHFHIPWVH